jgi:hypothetical protein
MVPPAPTAQTSPPTPETPYSVAVVSDAAQTTRAVARVARTRRSEQRRGDEERGTRHPTIVPPRRETNTASLEQGKVEPEPAQGASSGP